MRIVRLAEWQTRQLDWPLSVRRALVEAALSWQVAHKLPKPPLQWIGLEGKTLQVYQWVGVLEVEGYRVEIYPKLDAALLNNTPLDNAISNSTLRALLPMLDAAHFGDWVETGTANLGVAPLSFLDVWAFLLGKHLSLELRRGLVRTYCPESDDLPSVRGKIAIARQASANFNRMDRIACEWDEYTPDSAMNRLLKCACRVLWRRTSHPIARGLLGDCLFSLDEVRDAPASSVLLETERLVWTRGTQRFEPSFTLARRILQELAPDMEGASSGAWSFLVDMNAVFEGFCAAAIEARFRTSVETQKPLLTLLKNPNQIRQLADFVWTHQGRWIGDAKWKLLEQKRLSPDDVRQLTVYAHLLQKQESLVEIPRLAILYPTFDATGGPREYKTWNDTVLHLWPVRVSGADSLAESLLISSRLLLPSNSI